MFLRQPSKSLNDLYYSDSESYSTDTSLDSKQTDGYSEYLKWRKNSNISISSSDYSIPQPGVSISLPSSPICSSVSDSEYICNSPVGIIGDKRKIHKSFSNPNLSSNYPPLYPNMPLQNNYTDSDSYIYQSTSSSMPLLLTDGSEDPSLLYSDNYTELSYIYEEMKQQQQQKERNDDNNEIVLDIIPYQIDSINNYYYNIIQQQQQQSIPIQSPPHTQFPLPTQQQQQLSSSPPYQQLSQSQSQQPQNFQRSNNLMKFKPKLQYICKDFMQGKCHRGQFCKFIHCNTGVSNFESNPEICRDFLKGKCFRGKSCRYLHTNPAYDF